MLPYAPNRITAAWAGPCDHLAIVADRACTAVDVHDGRRPPVHDTPTRRAARGIAHATGLCLFAATEVLHCADWSVETCAEALPPGSVPGDVRDRQGKTDTVSRFRAGRCGGRTAIGALLPAVGAVADPRRDPKDPIEFIRETLAMVA